QAVLLDIKDFMISSGGSSGGFSFPQESAGIPAGTGGLGGGGGMADGQSLSPMDNPYNMSAGAVQPSPQQVYITQLPTAQAPAPDPAPPPAAPAFEEEPESVEISSGGDVSGGATPALGEDMGAAGTDWSGGANIEGGPAFGGGLEFGGMGQGGDPGFGQMGQGGGPGFGQMGPGEGPGFGQMGPGGGPGFGQMGPGGGPGFGQMGPGEGPGFGQMGPGEGPGFGQMGHSAVPGSGQAGQCECGAGQPESALVLDDDSDIEIADEVDLPLLAILAPWLSRAVAAMGKEQMEKLVELYDVARELPPRLKEALLALLGFYDDESSTSKPPGDVIVMQGIPLLVELDSLLLRHRSGPLESAVLALLQEKMAPQKKTRARKAGHG
ncbi:MAG: hypothetical protein V3R87_10495, partial [Dehalococcoidia bacterium]